MMKSLRKRAIGIIVCLSLLLSSSPLVTFAEVSGDSGVDAAASVQSEAGAEGSADPDPVSGAESQAGAQDGASVAASSQESGEESAGAAMSAMGDPAAEGDEAVNFDALSTEELFKLEAETARKELLIESDVAPPTVKSGSAATMIVSMTYNRVNTSPELKAGRVKVVVKTPKGINVEIVENDLFYDDIQIDPSTGESTTTMTMKMLPTANGGQGQGFSSFFLLNGVTPDATEYPISVLWLYSDETHGDVSLLNESAGDLTPQDFKITSKTEKFEWKSLSAAASPSSHNSLKDDNHKIPDTTISYSITNNHANEIENSAYTKTLVVSDVIKVDERVRLTADMLDGFTWANTSGVKGEGKVEPVIYYDEENGIVESFRATYTLTNESLDGVAPADLKNIGGTVKLVIKGAELDADKLTAAFEALPADTASLTIDKAFESTGLGAEATPCVTVASGAVQDGKQTLTGTVFAPVKVVYTRTIVKPEAPEDPMLSKGIDKAVTQIVGQGGAVEKDANGKNRIDYVYPGEKITYQLKDFGNKLTKTPLDDFKVVDVFEMDDMYPVQLTTGRYTTYPSSNKYALRVYTLVNGVEKISYQTNAAFSYHNSFTMDAKSGSMWGNVADGHFSGKRVDPATISKIEFDYGNYFTGSVGAQNSPTTANQIPAKFAVNASYTPTVTTVVKNTGEPNVRPSDENYDPNTQPRVINTAELFYSLTAKGEDGQDVKTAYSDSTEGAGDGDFKKVREVTYYASPTDVDEGNKRGVKLYGTNPGNPKIEQGDLIEYTVSFTNNYVNEAGYVFDPFIDDEHTGMKPYLEDPAGKLSHYGAAPFIAVVKVVDAAGKEVTGHGLTLEDYFTGDKPDGAPRSSNEPVFSSYDQSKILRMRLKGNVQYGWTVSVSYVMEITDPANVSNRFNAWAYPPGGGDQAVHLGGGSWKPGEGGTAEVVVPTLTFTQDITRVADGGIPGSAGKFPNATYPLDKGDKINVKLTLKNTGPEKNVVPVTFYGALSRFYPNANYYQDALRHGEATATIKFYERGGTEPKQTFEDVAYSQVNTNFVSGTTWTDGGGFMLPSPLKMGYLDYVTIEFQVSAESWADQNKSYLYESMYNYAMMGEVYNYYSPNGSQDNSNWDNNPATISFLSRNSSGIYISKEDVFYAGGYASNYNTSYMEANLTDEPTRPAATETMYYGLRVNLYNYSAKKPLEVDKIFVKLPQYERLVGMNNNTGVYKAEELPGTYGTENRRIAVITRVDGKNISLAPNANTGDLYLKTKMAPEDVAAAKTQAKLASDSSTFSRQYEMAFHTVTGETVQSTNTNKIAALTDSEKAEWGGGDMGVKDGGLYRAETKGTVYYRWRFPYPTLTLTPYKLVNGEYKQIGSTESLNTLIKVAWQVDVKLNTGSSALTRLKDSVVVVKLPAGFKYDGIVDDKLQAEKVTIDGNDYLILNPAEFTTANSLSFRVAATVGESYGPKKLEAALFTYDAFNRANPTNTRMLKSATGFPIDKLAEALKDTYEYAVKTDSSINIGGQFAFVTSKEVGNYGATYSTDANFKSEYAATSRENPTFRYRMKLKNNGDSGIPYRDVTVIDRLPAAEDYFNWDPAKRGSTTKVTMIKNRLPEVYLTTGTSTSGTKLTAGKDYTLEFAAVAPDQKFVYADYNLDKDATPSTVTWKTYSEWADISEAGAFRLRLSKDLSANQTLVIVFDAQAPKDAMPYQNPLAVNTFAAGFKVKLNITDFQITPETDLARVTFPDVIPMVIEGTVFTDAEGKVDGIYTPAMGDAPFNHEDIRLELYNKADETKTAMEPVKPTNGFYRFKVYEPGDYYVKIVGVPDTHEIYDQVKSEEQGNRFDWQTGMTDTIGCDANRGKTVIRNAALVKEVLGQLTLEKNLSGLSAGQIGDRKQKFVYKIVYTPKDPEQAARTFYEVVLPGAGGARVVSDLPRGTYEVSEVGWATGFEQEGGTAYRNDASGQAVEKVEITYNDTAFTATCTNKRLRENYMHAIADTINNFRQEQLPVN